MIYLVIALIFACIYLVGLVIELQLNNKLLAEMAERLIHQKEWENLPPPQSPIQRAIRFRGKD